MIGKNIKTVIGYVALVLYFESWQVAGRPPEASGLKPGEDWVTYKLEKRSAWPGISKHRRSLAHPLGSSYRSGPALEKKHVGNTRSPEDGLQIKRFRKEIPRILSRRRFEEPKVVGLPWLNPGHAGEQAFQYSYEAGRDGAADSSKFLMDHGPGSDVDNPSGVLYRPKFQDNYFTRGMRWKRATREEGRLKREVIRCPKCLEDFVPDDFFCPTDPGILDNRTEVQYTSKDKTAMYWNGHGLVFAPNQIGEEKQCLVLNVIGDTVFHLYGWKMKGLKLPKPLQDKFSVHGGMIKNYIVKYFIANTWSYIMDGEHIKVFSCDGDLVNPDVETQELLPQPMYAAGLQFCPQSSLGETPVMYVDLTGCRLYPKDEFARLYFDPKYSDPYTCLEETEWAGDGLKFTTNAGIHPEDATFTVGGFNFNLLPDAGIPTPNSKWYLEAILDSTSVVFSLKVGGAVLGMAQGMVESFTLSYKDVANVWKTVMDEGGTIKRFDTGMEHSPISSSQDVILALPHPVVAKALRLFPQTWWGHGKVLRLDLEVCDIFPIHDGNQECKVPYNLISRYFIHDKTLETFLSEESAIIDDPSGYNFQLKKPQRWKNHDRSVRASFPEHQPRKVTSLMLEGGNTPDGLNGLITDFNVHYGPENDSHCLPLSIIAATAVIQSEKPEDTRYIFMFNPPLATKYVEIFPQNWRDNAILRFALRGCHAGGHPYSFKNLATEPPSAPANSHSAAAALFKRRDS